MQWESLSNWFWILYYLLLLATLGTTIYYIVKEKSKILSIVTFMFVVTLPIISLINSIGRTDGMNELEHLMNQLQRGAIWSILTVVGYLFLILWWGLFLFKKVR